MEKDKLKLTNEELTEILEALQKAYELAGKRMVMAELYGEDENGEPLNTILVDNRTPEELN